jgi:hypothetical protein
MVSNKMGQPMTPVVCFASRYSVGATFLNWSYHWLAGHDTHWNHRTGTTAVPDNPNTGVNAHLFAKNFHAGNDLWHQHLEEYRALDQTQTVTFYGGPLRMNHSIEQQDVDFAAAFNTISSQIPVVLLVESNEDPWYFLKLRNQDPVDGNQSVSPQEHESYQQQRLNNIIKSYFKDSVDAMDNNIWDIRELLALNFKHIVERSSSYRSLLDLSKPHVYVDVRELWFDGESCMQRVMLQLGQPIQQDRLPQWQVAYQDWQASQFDIIKFGWYLPHIIESIVKGYKFDLSHVRMDLFCEAVIQGTLIHDHDLNLKCYGLEKFPSNTLELHQLLEKNTHSE